MYLIASFPKSGNHFVRYLIEWLTKRPTLGTGPIAWMHKNDKPIFVRLKQTSHYLEGHYDVDNAIAIKRHGGKGRFNLIKPEHKQRKLILIVRNYKEVLIRYCGGFNRPPELDKRQKECLLWYAELLDLYDTWPEQKLLIYYEDLITTPQTEIIRLAEFLDQDIKNNVEQLLANLDEHKKLSLRACGDNVTHGKHTIYYSKKLSKEWKDLLQNYLEKHRQPIYDKYLTRYN